MQNVVLFATQWKKLFNEDATAEADFTRADGKVVRVQTMHQTSAMGNGDVIEADDGILAIGSGGPYALAAARALIAHSDLDAEGIARESLAIAGNICIYTNSAIVVEVI